MEFLKERLPEGQFSTDVGEHINMSDNEVTVAIWKAAANPNERGHSLADLIISREHFRQVYEPTSSDQLRALEPAKNVYDALIAQFGQDRVKRDVYAQKGGSYDFPVYTKEGAIDSSLALSRTLSQVPTFSVDRVYVSTEIREEAERWLAQGRNKIIAGED